MKKPFVTTPEIDSCTAHRPEPRFCDHEGCTAEGIYPAPRSRDNLRDYLWLCLDHVRDYNKGWNYFADMDEDAIDKSIRHATTWERPSWHFGTGANSKQRLEDLFDDPLGIFGSYRTAPPETRAISDEERRAWKELELTPEADWTCIKRRYKTLVKQHHPDANGGNKDAEEKLKSINHAFAVLEKARGRNG